jgi:membrane-associated phospholipid phosphatase
MDHLPFGITAMQYLADHRTPFLTQFFLLASLLGDVQGYVLIGTFIYVVHDKKLAVRLLLLVSVTMALNHLLKVALANPRPFLQEGTYLQKWAVSAENARELVTEYSTPSGHAMAAGSFYTFLYGCVRSRVVRVMAVAAVVLIGLSRPYLGVHYVEDIALGWVVGLGVGLLALRYADDVGAHWNRIPYSLRIGAVVTTSLALWLVSAGLNSGPIDDPPRAFMGYAGTFTGIVIAQPLELKFVDFDPRSSSFSLRLLRFAFAVVAALLTLQGLALVFGKLADNYSLVGQLLQYLRYTVTAVISIFVVPLILTRIGLAGTHKQRIAALGTKLQTTVNGG